MGDNILNKKEEDSVWTRPKRAEMVARAPSEEAAKALLSFLPERWSSEPCLAFSLVFGPSPSS